MDFDLDLDNIGNWADLVDEELGEETSIVISETTKPSGFIEIEEAGLAHPEIALQMYAWALCEEERYKKCNEGEEQCDFCKKNKLRRHLRPEEYLLKFPRLPGQKLSEAILMSVIDGKWLKKGEKSPKDSDGCCYAAYRDHVCSGKGTDCLICHGNVGTTSNGMVTTGFWHTCNPEARRRHRLSCSKCHRKNGILVRYCTTCFNRPFPKNKDNNDVSCGVCNHGFVGIGLNRQLCPNIIPNKHCKDCHGTGRCWKKCTGICPLLHYTTNISKDKLIERCACRKGHRLGDCKIKGYVMVTDPDTGKSKEEYKHIFQSIDYCEDCGNVHPHIHRLEPLSKKERQSPVAKHSKGRPSNPKSRNKVYTGNNKKVSEDGWNNTSGRKRRGRRGY